VLPNRGGAVIVLSNEDGLNLIGPLSQQIATLVFLSDQPAASEKDTGQVRSILEGLQEGKIDRALFTSNANFYFSDTALADCRSSLTALGKLRSVTATSESLRGGMIHRSYRAQFEKKTVVLNIYVMTGGKYEQFLVMDQL
jgi:hypothetical protein